VAVELAELIGQLRAELTKAMRSGQDEELRFEVGPVELELTVAVQRDGAAGAKVRFWVVELGSDAKVAAASTQRIKLTLDPRRAGDPDRRPTISGAASAGENDDD
jgi:Trypsin-co-occurring domain 2